MRWLIFIFVVHVAKVLCEETTLCSKFHYEAQMLDKMIRMEVKVEAMEKEISKTNQLVLESIRTLTSDREVAKTEREDFNKDYSDLKKNMLKEVKVIRDTLLTPTVAFKARGPADLSLETGQTIIFNNVMLNEGGAYDNITGIFTAPVEGTYLFTMQVCIQPNIQFYYGIVLDNTVQTGGKFYENAADTCHTADAILVLRPSQKVWVKCLLGSTKNALYMQTSTTYVFWNTFSGVLIHK